MRTGVHNNVISRAKKGSRPYRVGFSFMQDTIIGRFSHTQGWSSPMMYLQHRYCLYFFFFFSEWGLLLGGLFKRISYVCIMSLFVGCLRAFFFFSSSSCTRVEVCLPKFECLLKIVTFCKHLSLFFVNLFQA